MFAVIAAYGTGFFAHWPAAQRAVVVGWHNAVGVTACALATALLLWRGFGRVPDPLPAYLAWQVAARRLVTATTYLLLLLVPISGWLLASAEGPWIRFFNASFVPGLSLSEGARQFVIGSQLHAMLALALFAAIGVHLGITLYHHVVLRDRTLGRMLDGS